MARSSKASKAALVLVVAGGLLMTSSALAATKPSAKQRAAVLQAVVDCRKVADREARVDCYDAAAAKLDQAEATGQVLVVDREQAVAVRKEVFGLQLPSLDIFGAVTKGADAEDIDRVTSKVKSAGRGADGRWQIVLENGAVWRQIDTFDFAKSPYPGASAEVRRAALGSFMMKIDGGNAIRVHRDR